MGSPQQELEKHMQGLLQEIEPELNEDQREEEFDSDLSDDDRSRLSFKETLRSSVWEFGGPPGVARHLKQTYDVAPKGSNTRARIVDRLIQGIQDCGEDTELGDEESIEALDDHLRPIYFEEFVEKLPEDLRAKVVGHLA